MLVLISVRYDDIMAVSFKILVFWTVMLGGYWCCTRVPYCCALSHVRRLILIPQSACYDFWNNDMLVHQMILWFIEGRSKVKHCNWLSLNLVFPKTNLVKWNLHWNSFLVAFSWFIRVQAGLVLHEGYIPEKVMQVEHKIPT